jgi:DNA gyrase/topoisomerase IV subunit B
MAKKSHKQEGFEIAEGLAGVRLNPGLYLGELGDDMAFRVVKEEVDNAYDEAVAGRNNLIEVIIDYDQDIHIVADGAGGIPTDYKKLKDGTKITIMTAAFTRTHAGGKFNDKSYKTSAGTHGVGVAAANAVCESMRVFSFYNGKLVKQEFAAGEIISKGPDPVKVKALDKDFAGLLKHKPKKYGTIVVGKLDQTVVSSDARRGKKLPKKYTHARVPAKRTAEWLHDMAMLNPGLEIILTVIKKGKSKSRTFLNKKKLDVIPKLIADKNEVSLVGKPFVFETDNIKCSIAWSDNPDSNLLSTYVNTSPTIDGGWHKVGLQAALSTALKPFLPKTKKKTSVTPSDLVLGAVGMFNWCMHGAQFTSQVKDKLASRVDKEVAEALTPALTEYFDKNKRVAKHIIKCVIAMNKGRDELQATIKSMADVKKKTKGNSLPGCLAAAPKAKVHERELYIVEGDSAAGTAIDSRNSDYQEVLSANGKPLNALNNTLAKVIGHKDIGNFLISMGADLRTLDLKAEKPTLDVSKLRVGHVILLVDSDPDGGHIAVLYLAAIYRLMPDLFMQGRVWCVDSPLFAAVHKGKVHGGMTFAEARKSAPSAVKDREIVRIKGWGEVDENFLEPIAFDPRQRKLIRINPFESAEAERHFVSVVGEGPEFRRQLLGLSD